MCKNTNGTKESAAEKEQNGYSVERVFVGTRTAEQVVADLIKVHMDERGGA